MEKYRLISRWTNDYYPKGYRQDGKPQERVENVGIASEEEAKYDMEYFNKHLTDGSWVAERFEIDDDKYRCFELILPEPEPVEKNEVVLSPEKVEEVIPIIESVEPPEVLKVEKVFGPTKTIYVTKYIATQRSLGREVYKINGRIPPEERKQIYTDFNNNLVEKISITEAVARLGGVKYSENGKEINVEFLDGIDHHTKEFILAKINKKN